MRGREGEREREMKTPNIQKLNKSECGIVHTAYNTLQIASFLQNIPVDGLWIDMNEPSNFCDGGCKGAVGLFISNATKPLSAKVQASLTDPPYYINNQNKKQSLNIKTLDPTAVQFGGVTHYNAHNMYGRYCIYS